MLVECDFCHGETDVKDAKQVVLKRPKHKSLFTLWRCNKCKDKNKVAVPKIGTLIVISKE